MVKNLKFKLEYKPENYGKRIKYLGLPRSRELMIGYYCSMYARMFARLT